VERRPPNYLAASLVALANYMRRVGSLRFKQKYGLSLVEGWMVARLGIAAPMSVDELASRAGLAPSQISRVIADMSRKRLVRRRTNRDRRREAELDLTERGREIYTDIMADAPDYHRRLTAGLSRSELEALASVLPRLIQNAQAILRQEQAVSSDRERDA